MALESPQPQLSVDVQAPGTAASGSMEDSLRDPLQGDFLVDPLQLQSRSEASQPSDKPDNPSSPIQLLGFSPPAARGMLSAQPIQLSGALLAGQPVQLAGGGDPMDTAIKYNNEWNNYDEQQLEAMEEVSDNRYASEDARDTEEIGEGWTEQAGYAQEGMNDMGQDPPLTVDMMFGPKSHAALAEHEQFITSELDDAMWWNKKCCYEPDQEEMDILATVAGPSFPVGLEIYFEWGSLELAMMVFEAQRRLDINNYNTAIDGMLDQTTMSNVIDLYNELQADGESQSEDSADSADSAGTGDTTGFDYDSAVEDTEVSADGFSTDMGEVDSIGNILLGLINIVELMAPTPGDSTKAKLEVSGRHPSGLGVTFLLQLEVSQDSDYVYHATGTIGLSLNYEMDVYYGSMFAALQGTGFFKAEGDSGREIMDLFGLALYYQAKDSSSWIANMLWDKDYDDDILETLDNDDKVTTGGAITAKLGMGQRGHIKGAANSDNRIEVEGGYQTETTYTNEGYQSAETNTAKFFKVSAQGDVPSGMRGEDWQGSISYEGNWPDRGDDKHTIAVRIARKADMSDFVDLLENNELDGLMILWIGGAARLIDDVLDAMGSQNRNARHDLRAIRSQMQDVALSATISNHKLIERINTKFNYNDASMSHGLDLKLEWEEGDSDVKMSVALTRKSSLETSVDIKMMSILVAVENIAELVSIPDITIPL